MTVQHQARPPVSPLALWGGLLGGAVAWTVHLIGMWVVAEFGCVAARGGDGGVITLTYVLLSVLSLLCLAGAGLAAFVAWRSERQIAASGEDAPGRDTGLFMARTGIIANGLFALVIVSQTVPLFFFASRC